MAKKKDEVQSSEKDSKKNYNKRLWTKPKTRAEQYANELKNKVHNSPYTYTKKDGSVVVPKKNGQELTDLEKGVRMGYLQCQSDHAGTYKYAKARQDGFEKGQAKIISQSKVKYPSPYAPKD